MAAFMAFVSGYLIRRFGWTFTAMIPPAIMLITTFGFFLFLMFGHQFEDIILALLHTTPLYIAVLFGSAQNVLGRVSKYTLFDATKELSFTPLHSDEKINAKSVIDGIGSRLGKSGGSIMYQVLIVMFSGIAGTTPYVAALICLFIFVWMTSVKSLGLQVEPLIHKK
jgi:AAA family ATP:ADP antiporter